MTTATTNGQNGNAQNGNAQQAETKNTPVHEIRLGRIKGTVWRNKTELGYRFNTTFARLYRVEDAWRESNSFGRGNLSKVTQKHNGEIFEAKRSQFDL